MRALVKAEKTEGLVMRDEPVPEKEFQDKKRGMVASFALSLENPQSVINNHITRWIYKLPADYWDRYPERIAAVTQARVQEAARKYLETGRLQIVAVGDLLATMIPAWRASRLAPSGVLHTD